MSDGATRRAATTTTTRGGRLAGDCRGGCDGEAVRGCDCAGRDRSAAHRNCRYRARRTCQMERTHTHIMIAHTARTVDER